MIQKLFNSIFWRLGVILLLLLAGVTAIHMSIAYKSAEQFSLEANQRLGREIAAHTAREIGPYFGKKDWDPAVHDIMHSMMVINPDVEVYLLDTAGSILKYVAPYKVVILDSIDLGPVQAYLGDTIQEQLILGSDPRNPEEKNIFAAARVEDSTGFQGYVYIILASQVYNGVRDAVRGSYVLKSGRDAMFSVAIISLVLGLFLIWIITRNFRIISSFLRKFREGDLGARVRISGKGEVGQLAGAINEMASTIESNVAELKSVERLRKELVANISHDLRTPIASIAGYTETLKLNKDDIPVEKSDEFLDAIYRNAQRLEKMVNDLFELSKLEAKERVINPEPLQLGELMTDVVAKYNILAKNRGISINTLVTGEPPLVYVDVALIDRVFQNIIDNALRHCEQGDVIHLEIHSKTKNVEVRITDTGEGIKEVELPHIFDRYKRGIANGEGGGLGLAIVKKILELHQSSIHVASKVSEGTSFWFELPVYKGA